MHILVAGGGRLGGQAARLLCDAGHDVVVVEADPARAATLRAQGLPVAEGNACSVAVLEAAGGLRAQVLMACTGLDEQNLVVALLAKRRLEVPRVVASVNDEANRWLFDESWGVDVAVSPASSLVGMVEPARKQ